jgi:hypothetical protein
VALLSGTLELNRVIADEFFRAFFTQGIHANGEVLPGLWYSASVGNIKYRGFFVQAEYYKR